MYIPNPNRYQKMQYQRCGDSGLLLPKFHLVYGIILETIATMIT